MTNLAREKKDIEDICRFICKKYWENKEIRKARKISVKKMPTNRICYFTIEDKHISVVIDWRKEQSMNLVAATSEMLNQEMNVIVHNAQYVIYVGYKIFEKFSREYIDVYLIHELGHVINGDLDNYQLLRDTMGKRYNFEDEPLIELLADVEAIKICGECYYMEAFRELIKSLYLDYRVLMWNYSRRNKLGVFKTISNIVNCKKIVDNIFNKRFRMAIEQYNIHTK